MKYPFYFLLAVIVLTFPCYTKAQEVQSVEKDAFRVRTIIVIFDGLRPDYITPEWMPRLHAFSKQAAYAKDNHSIFPTVTRVNAASYVTGSNPAAHGLLGNTIYLPEVNRNTPLNTGNAGQLRHAMEITSGKLLTAPSLGEILRTAGGEMYVYSSGSTGQAYLQNHTVNGAIINPDLILPRSFRSRVESAIGSPPGEATPNNARHQWITGALCRYTLTQAGPLVSAIWFSDPDGTAHKQGIGAPLTIAALKEVDARFGSILDTLAARGLEQQFNIIVTADHGFVTHTGKEGVSEFLIRSGFKKNKDSDDVIVAGGALYVKARDSVVIRRMVEALQQEQWVGAIFTKAAKPGSMKGIVKGTLSFESVHWNHPGRVADILVAANWNNARNSSGYEGSDAATGVAGHGGTSPYEIHIPLIASGPSFKPAFESNLPTSNIDIAPTVLYTLGIDRPQEMQGRVMYELLRDNNRKPTAAKKEVIVAEAKLKHGRYRVRLEKTIYDNHSYINYVSVSGRVSNQ